MTNILFFLHEPFIHNVEKLNESIKTIPKGYQIHIATSGIVDVNDHNLNLKKVIKKKYTHHLINNDIDIDIFNKSYMINKLIEKIDGDFIIVENIVNFSNLKLKNHKDFFIGLINSDENNVILKNLSLIYTNKKTWNKYYIKKEINSSIYRQLNFIFNYLEDNNVLYYYDDNNNKDLKKIQTIDNNVFNFNFKYFTDFYKDNSIKKSCCLSNNSNLGIFYKYQVIRS